VKGRILDVLKRIKRPGMDKLIDWLETSDFFTAPASTKFHGVKEGGLAEHSWNVYNLFCEKLQRFNMNMGADSAAIVALLHDVNKIGKYKWNKDENKYDYQEDFICGHGSKSVNLIQRFIRLDEQEIMFIHWHMGPFSEDRYGYKDASNKHPYLILLFTADFEASRFLDDRK
jgi:23S rRNA maturation-related 3'-5' exoribonuclease YhaM